MVSQATPGMTQSKPINIEFPKREHNYTALSARGDIPGGYFPNHEITPRQYRTHPFSTRHEPDHSATATSDSSSASPTKSTSESILSPTISNLGDPTLQEGKHYPSNYTVIAPSLTDRPSTSPSHIEISSAEKRPAHERHTSELKRRLQQYQRDRITQARIASPPGASAHGEHAMAVKLSSPGSQPLDSPGWITPFEMEESARYMVVGDRSSHTDTKKETPGG